MGNIDTHKVQERIDQMTDNTEKNEAQEALNTFIEETKNELDQVKKKSAEKLLIIALKEKGIDTSNLISQTQSELTTLTTVIKPQKTREELSSDLVKEVVAQGSEKMLQEGIARKMRQQEVTENAMQSPLAISLTNNLINFSIQERGSWGISIPITEFKKLKQMRRNMRKGRQNTDHITILIKQMRYARNQKKQDIFTPVPGFVPHPFTLNKYTQNETTNPKTIHTNHETPTTTHQNETTKNNESKEVVYGIKNTNADMLYNTIRGWVDGSESINCNGKRHLKNGAKLLTKLGPSALMIWGALKAIKGLRKTDANGKRDWGKFWSGIGILGGGFALGHTNRGGKQITDIRSGDSSENAKKSAEKLAHEESKKINNNEVANNAKENNNNNEAIKNIFDPAYTNIMLGWLPLKELHHYVDYDPSTKAITKLKNLDLLKKKVAIDNTLSQAEKDARTDLIDELIKEPKNKTTILEGLEKMGINQNTIQEGTHNEKKGSVYYRYTKYTTQYKKTVEEAKIQEAKEKFGATRTLTEKELKTLKEKLNDKDIEDIKLENGEIIIKKNGERQNSKDSSAFLLGSRLSGSWIVGEKVISNTVDGTKIFVGDFWDGILEHGKDSVVVTTVQDISNQVAQYAKDGYTYTIEEGKLVMKKAGEKTVEIGQKLFNGQYAHIAGYGIIKTTEGLFSIVGDAIIETGKFIGNNVSGMFSGVYDAFTDGK